jgi:hypothetical protein
MMDNPFVKLMFAPDALPWMTAIDTNDGPWTQWFFAAGRSRRLAGSAPVGLCRELVGNLSKTLPSLTPFPQTHIASTKFFDEGTKR